MRSFEKDYKYLLLNLIPRRRLSVDRRRQIDRAIAGGSPEEIRQVSVLALEDLCKEGYFRRTDAVRENGHVSLTYLRRHGNYHLRVVLPIDEWRSAGGASAPITEPPSRPPVIEPAPIVALPAGGTTVDIVPDLIRSLSINGETQSILDRLESIMAVLPEWFQFADGKLVLSEERLNAHGEPPSENVRVLPEGQLADVPGYDRCRRSGQVELVDGVTAIQLGVRPPQQLQSPRGFTAFTVALVPILPLGEFWGVLVLWISGDLDASGRDRVDLARAAVSKVIENVLRLENLTSVDKLTGVYNRHFYDLQVRIEIERATRSGTELTMLVVDIDDFKQINDTMGHRKGDEALALVADLIRSNLRKIDLPFRYGGEEFVILLPGTGSTEAIHTAERLRLVVSESRDVADRVGEPVNLTVSIGAAVFPGHARSEEELFAKADAALYRAKSTGKNRVEFHREQD